MILWIMFLSLALCKLPVKWGTLSCICVILWCFSRELREKIHPEIMELIKQQRLNRLCEGTCFRKISSRRRQGKKHSHLNIRVRKLFLFFLKPFLYFWHQRFKAASFLLIQVSVLTSSYEQHYILSIAWFLFLHVDSPGHTKNSLRYNPKPAYH